MTQIDRNQTITDFRRFLYTQSNKAKDLLHTMNTFGGYDFEVVGEVMKECECPICLLLIKDAMELPCTHGLCLTCLQKWEQDNQEKNSGLLCPSCKVAYDQEKVQRSKMVDRIITTSLKVKCKENKNGCNWIGTISDYKDHEMKCLFKSIQCNFHGCDKIVKLSDLKEHQKICQFRVVQCSYCEVEEQFNKLEIHYEICNLYPVNCINKECDVRIPRSELEDHIQNHCNFQMIHCEYEAIGCHAIIQRKDLHTHIDTPTSMQYHMRLLLQNNKVTTADLNIRLSNVHKMLEKTAQELEETKDKLHATEEKLETITIDLDQTKTKVLEHTKKAIKNETQILKKQFEDNTVFNNQKFEEIKENRISIEENCLQSTKVLALMNTTITQNMESTNNGLLNDLMNILNMPIKVDNLSTVPKKVDKLSRDEENAKLDLSLEKDYGITLINKNQSERKQHIELLENLTFKFLFRDFKSYANTFIEVTKNMEKFTLYYIGDNEFYVKCDLAEYVDKSLIITFHTISDRNWLRNLNSTKHNTNELNLNYDGRIIVSFYKDKWNGRNTKGFIVHPKEEKEIQNGSNQFKCFEEILLQEYLYKGEILIKVKKI